MDKKILIVDDEAELREILSGFFKNANFDVTTASGGIEAFELVKTQKFDCVLSDIRMPLGTGIELAQNIKSLGSKTPIMVLLTGFTDLSPKAVTELGVLKVFAKPFSALELIAFISKSLAK